MEGADNKSQEWEKKHGQPQKRRYYRILYPITERPNLIFGDDDVYEIIDICEGGVRFFAKKGGQVFLPFQTLKAKIKFHNDEVLEIEGKVLRVNDDMVVIELAKKIPYRQIVKEQLYFRKKPDYP
jgi:hypothetical protein